MYKSHVLFQFICTQIACQELLKCMYATLSKLASPGFYRLQYEKREGFFILQAIKAWGGLGMRLIKTARTLL